MVDNQNEQVLASVMAEERAAAARVAAISARRSEMAREALALQQQLARHPRRACQQCRDTSAALSGVS